MSFQYTQTNKKVHFRLFFVTYTFFFGKMPLLGTLYTHLGPKLWQNCCGFVVISIVTAHFFYCICGKAYRGSKY